MDDHDKTGTVYWFTGLAGAGKTSIGKQFHKKLINETSSKSVFLDGDELREAFGNKFGHSLEERRYLAHSYSRLCYLISKQGIDVVCCTISMFNSCREWNRSNIIKYKEIFIHASIKVLQKRNQKNLYKGEDNKTANDVVGINMQYELPLNPDIKINNDGLLGVEEIVRRNYYNIIKF
tara:strand:- start:855 stop:1388 length:534 start_codon:yes stop_codon:yes gene_type:complete